MSFPAHAPRETTSIASCAERAAAEQLRRIGGEAIFSATRPYYLENWRSNLLAGVTPRDCEGDLQAGAGNELGNVRDAPSKFSAARSSSALAVNTFAPFRRSPERLSLVGLEGFEHAWFEKNAQTACARDAHLTWISSPRNAMR